MGDHIAIAYSTSSEDDVGKVTIPEEPVAPLCDGTPRRLWVEKCVVLHRPDGFPIAKGICRNVSSDVVVGSSGPLGDSRVAIQISSSLSMADTPDEWRYSIRAWPIEFVSTMVPASETMNCEHNITPKLQEFPPDLP